MVQQKGIFRKDPKKLYIRHLGIIKQTMTMIRYAISSKCLRIKKRIMNKKTFLKDKKTKLKKILRTNLRISSYITKLQEQFIIDINNNNVNISDMTFLTSTKAKKYQNIHHSMEL